MCNRVPDSWAGHCPSSVWKCRYVCAWCVHSTCGSMIDLYFKHLYCRHFASYCSIVYLFCFDFPRPHTLLVQSFAMRWYPISSTLPRKLNSRACYTLGWIYFALGIFIVLYIPSFDIHFYCVWIVCCFAFLSLLDENVRNK